MFAVLRPDPPPPAKVAHVVVSYDVVLRDRLGRKWICYYPVNTPGRYCHLINKR